MALEARKIENSEVLYFKLPKKLDKVQCDEINRKVAEIGIENFQSVELDFMQTEEISLSFINGFVQLSKKFKSHEKEICSVNLNADIKREVFSNGVAAVFNVNVSRMSTSAKQEADKQDSKPKIKLDTELLNPFIEGVLQTFSKQMNVNLKASKPKLKDRAHPRRTEIAGLINLQSAGFNFSLALCFTADVFLKVYESMVGEKHEKITDEIEDAAAEILNIIYGHAKTILKEKNYPLEKAIPTVMSGDKIKIIAANQQPTLELIFKGAVGEFHLEINIESK